MVKCIGGALGHGASFGRQEKCTMKHLKAVTVLVLGLWISPALAQQNNLIVEKKVFELPSYTTVGGKTIKNVRIGWESYGQPNADQSNVILIAHFFSGTSHAAGKYTPS